MVMDMLRLKELRTENKMKQSTLASYLRVTPQSVSRYETGERDMGPDTIARLCEIFGVTADYLLGLSTQRSAQISEDEAALVAAYHAAPAEIRDIVDTALKNYKEGKKAAVG